MSNEPKIEAGMVLEAANNGEKYLIVQVHGGPRTGTAPSYEVVPFDTPPEEIEELRKKQLLSIQQVQIDWDFFRVVDKTDLSMKELGTDAQNGVLRNEDKC